MWGEYLLSQTLLQVAAMLIIQRWNWQSENAQIRIIKLFMSIFHSFFMQLQERRPGLAHITADEILKSRLRWTPRFVSAAADWSCRRKPRWTSVWRAEAQTDRNDHSEDFWWENLRILIHHCGGVMIWEVYSSQQVQWTPTESWSETRTLSFCPRRKKTSKSCWHLW